MAIPRTPTAVACFFIGVVAVTAQTTRPPAPVRPTGAPKQYTIEQFLNTTAIRGASFSADESRILFSSNKSGVWNVYSIGTAGGPWTQLTRSTESTYSVSYFPHDDRILFTRDQGGDELNHLYVRTPGGEERDLTPGQKLKASFLRWTTDGDAFYVMSNERDAKYFDVYRYDASTYERSVTFENSVGYDPRSISGDGHWLALVEPRTTDDNDAYLWNVETKSISKISAHSGQATYEPADFDPGSRFLYYLTNDGTEFTRVRRYELATGRQEDVERADWDVIYTAVSHHGKYRVSGVNRDGRPALELADAATGKNLPLGGMAAGGVTEVEFSPSDRKMALYASGDRAPSNLYVTSVSSAGIGAVRRLTSSLNPDIDPQDLVTNQIVRFKARDGLTIPNVLYKPLQATPTQKAPAIVWVHGGPGGQTMRAYSPLIQFLVNHGYVVLGINNRGSSGYGKTFLAADDKKHGHEPLWDCVDAKKYLATLPYVDARRIGIAGGSYGGYMVLAALSLQPDVFDVGVDMFGISNWIRTLESMPSWWEAQRRALYSEIGDPQADRQMLEDISPLFHADRIQRPLMVLQGANDPRVIKPESDDIVAAVKKNGVPVEYIVFPDEGHGFTKKKNQIEGYRAMLRFLDRYLKDKPNSSR